MTGLCRWFAPPETLDLRTGEVHLWRAFLDYESGGVLSGKGELSSDELARAARFVFTRDRDRFIVGRQILRRIVAKYLHRSPAKITFIYGTQGKPALCLSDSDPPLRFNVSHAANLAVYAVSLNREIGVDIEVFRDGVNAPEIVERFFSCQEHSEFRSVPNDKQKEAFFLCWTRKEAYLKALGFGLSIPLDSFDVSLTPDEPARLYIRDSKLWTLHSFQPDQAFAGAVVVEGEHSDLKFWHYTSPDVLGH